MVSVCVIGLPTQLRVRLEAACLRAKVTVCTLLAGNGPKEGTPWLLPNPREVVPLLHQYVDNLPQYSEAHIVVLPYVDIPSNLLSEIGVLEEAGARIVRAIPNDGPWPARASNRGFDEAFRESLFRALTAHLALGAPADAPSAYFEQVRKRNPNLLLAGAVLRRCDSVREDRYQFMRDAADAFEALLNGDPGVPLEQFFHKRNLCYAQSGSISAKVTISKEGKDVYIATTEVHLKLGDATTKAGAARIYYHRFEIEKITYLAVLHAGPHPDRNMKVEIEI